MMLALTGCASSNVERKKVEAEVQSIQIEPHVDKARDLIQKSPDLSSTQKEKLFLLEEQNKQNYIKITDEIEKTKIVMIQTILKPQMNNKEFKILKKKLAKLDQQRMDNGFASVAKARDIIASLEQLQKTQFDDFMFHDLVKGM
ncbi:MAG: hypothetical protein H7177_15365 [Rhizobacter sp.]|nr:hypothetical protein [Bacteriovorax sp.]